ncbi:MAG: COG3014 family protein [bacterium]
MKLLAHHREQGELPPAVVPLSGMRSSPLHLYFIIIMVGFTLCGGCAPALNYRTLENHMRARNCPVAIEFLKKNKKSYGHNNTLIFLLDSAMINLRCGNYDESNTYFHKAEKLAEELWTKKLSKEAASFITNDFILPYNGEDFERALINLFSALNYVIEGKNEDALVECRRLDSLLLSFNDKYEKKNVYKEDAFGRYLSGMLYEANGNLEDAYIDYFKAFKAFQDYGKHYGTRMPESLLHDIIRVAQATGRADELDRYNIGADHYTGIQQKNAEKMGRIVMIHLNGKSPVKIEDKLIVGTKEGPVSMAFPRYVVNKPQCSASTMIIKGPSKTITVEAELVEDINKIAVKNLDDRKGRIMAKAIARVALKQTATKKIDDPFLRFAANVTNTVFIEKADTRSWKTLPGEIYLARSFVPEGEYCISVNHCGGSQHLDTIHIKAGETAFLLSDNTI